MRINNAFSERTPYLQLVWDSTSIKQFQFCPRSYYYYNIEGWQQDSVDLHFGRHIATGIELYHKLRLRGYDRESACVQVIAQALNDTYDQETGEQWGGSFQTLWKCSGETPYKNEKGNRAKCPHSHAAVWYDSAPPEQCECRSDIRIERQYVGDHTSKNRVTLIRALIWYAEVQPENLDDGLKPYTFPDGRVAVELSGKLPLPFKTMDGDNYILAFNFDYIGDYSGQLFIVDNKTTNKPLNDSFFTSYACDTQFDNYDLIGATVYADLNLAGTAIEAIQMSQSGVEIGFQPYYKTDAQREEHLADLEIWIRMAEAYARAKYWPMNKRNCWTCRLNKVCAADPSERDRVLRENFTQGEPWNPARER